MEGLMIYISDNKGDWNQLLHLPMRSERWIKNHLRPLCQGEGSIIIYSGIFAYDENEEWGLGDRQELIDQEYNYAVRDGRMSN